MERSVPAATFSWLAGGVHVDVLLGVALLGLAYAGAWAGKGDRPSSRHFLCFDGALFTLVLTLNGSAPRPQ